MNKEKELEMRENANLLDKEETTQRHALLLIHEIAEALKRGTKHIRKSDNKLLETPKEIIEALLSEKSIILEPMKEKEKGISQTCPRRMHELGPWECKEGLDEWTIPDNRCSFCGSIHPDDLFAAIANKKEIHTTTKNYKIYVGRSSKKFYFQHLNEDQKQQFVDLINSKSLIFSEGFGFSVLPFFVVKKD